MLAAATAAGSVAFACTQFAQVSIAGHQDQIEVNAGETVVVEGRRFDQANGTVYFAWKTHDGLPLGEDAEPETVANSSPSSPTTLMWADSVTIPANAATGMYTIVGFQTKNGQIEGNDSIEVYVHGRAVEEEPRFQDPLPPPPPPPAPPAVPPPAPSPDLPGQPRPATPDPARLAAAPAARPSPAPAANPGGAVATEAPAGTDARPAPAAAAPASRADLLDPTQPIAVPAPNEIWSGLDKPASVSALLDAPAPQTSGGVPAGAVLLGMGALALAGTAAVVGQRRLVLARAIRR